jgi:hypothetical protein
MATTWGRVHLVAFTTWVLTWVVAVVLAGGQTQIVADTPREYTELAILFASAGTIVLSAVQAGLGVGGMRATWGPLASAGALLGIFLPDAVRIVRRTGATGDPE